METPKKWSDEERAWRLRNFGRPYRITLPPGTHPAYLAYFEKNYLDACARYGLEPEPVENRLF